MAFIKGHEFIFENKSGIVFNFYLNKQRYIEYMVSDKKQGWKEKGLVFDRTTENFHLDVDNNNNIHVISYSEDGCLYYHRHLSKTWVNHCILEYPANQRIIYPIIKHMNNQIHIFYYLIHNESKNKAYLLHLKFHDKKYSTNHIVTVDTHTYINPFKIFENNNKMILLYASVIEGNEQIFISKLNMSTEQWTDPLCVTSSEDKKIYVDGIFDSTETLHIIWSKFDEESLAVRYLKLNTESMKANKSEPVSLSSESSCSFPVLVYYSEILWAIWIEMNKIISCYSTDMGENWSEPYNHENTRKIDFKRYRYVVGPVNNKGDILCDFIFGTPYPYIQFLGFGGESNDEVPTK